MKSIVNFSSFRPHLGILCLAVAFVLPQTAIRAAVMKVRVSVQENNGSTTAAAQPTTPAPKEKPPKTPPANQVKPATPPKPGSGGGGSDPYTHTTNKSLTVSVGNTTKEPLDVTVKVTFLAKDEAGKHEIVTEKALENKMTLAAGKSDQFTTEEVSFTHTSAHRPAPKGGAGKGKPAPMEPASGHMYAGYKVEVFQGSDLVGSSSSTGGY